MVSILRNLQHFAAFQTSLLAVALIPWNGPLTLGFPLTVVYRPGSFVLVGSLMENGPRPVLAPIKKINANQLSSCIFGPCINWKTFLAVKSIPIAVHAQWMDAISRTKPFKNFTATCLNVRA